MLKNYRNKVKELATKNQELEKLIKAKLGLTETDALPVDWEKDLISRTEIEAKYDEEKLAKEQALQEKEDLITQLEVANATKRKFELEVQYAHSDDNADDDEVEKET